MSPDVYCGQQAAEVEQEVRCTKRAGHAGRHLGWREDDRTGGSAVHSWEDRRATDRDVVLSVTGAHIDTESFADRRITVSLVNDDTNIVVTMHGTRYSVRVNGATTMEVKG